MSLYEVMIAEADRVFAMAPDATVQFSVKVQAVRNGQLQVIDQGLDPGVTTSQRPGLEKISIDVPVHYTARAATFDPEALRAVAEPVLIKLESNEYTDVIGGFPPGTTLRVAVDSCYIDWDFRWLVNHRRQPGGEAGWFRWAEGSRPESAKTAEPENC
ncbi:hypothetical protein F3N42_11515 [Marinihelvus fidelis]|uniref:Uncharacterized protein n=1 Tax=Marinihelvus fidelis TaxID=2613842 RepID=A0A5N0T894_9GAMM|nr:hypothetical protein [Marinihelvus fidelis]KAA9130971.1 hypothetical protein F3N42_11515 [Marinihelvus fidelis]